MRPVLVGFLLVANAFVVAALALGRPEGWLPPFIAFGSTLVGFVVFEVWALRQTTDPGLDVRVEL